MSRYYAPDGTEIDMLDWPRIRNEHPELWRVGKDSVPGGGVSTVWLGLDHGDDEGGPPLIYETLFSAHNTERIERYSTREEAEAGHAAMVEWARRTAWRRRLARRLLDLASRVGGEHYYVG